MDKFQLSDTLVTYLRTNYPNEKTKLIFNTIDTVYEILKIASFPDIDLSTFNQEADDMIYNIETLGKQDITISLDGYVITTFSDWLETMGISIDRDFHALYGGGYTILFHLFSLIEILLNPSKETALLVVESEDTEYEDNVLWFSELFAQILTDIHPIIFYEFILDINATFKENVLNKSRMVSKLNLETIDPNVKQLTDICIRQKIDFDLMPTTIVKAIFEEGRTISSLDENIIFLFKNNPTIVSTKQLYNELLACAIYSTEMIDKTLTLELINNIDLDNYVHDLENIELLSVKRSLNEFLNKVGLHE